MFKLSMKDPDPIQVLHYLESVYKVPGFQKGCHSDESRNPVFSEDSGCPRIKYGAGSSGPA